MSDVIKDSINKKQRLGRGLGSLLGGQELPQSAQPTIPTPSPSAGLKSGSQAKGPGLGSGQAPGASLGQTNLATQNSQSTADVAPEMRIWKMAIDKIRPGAYQPRSAFNKEKLMELATSIKENGVLQPVVVRKLANGSYELIAGERRWRAAQMAGLHEVPAIVKSFDDRATLQMALIENVQREDLNPIEEAEAYQRLISEFGLTQQQVAEKVGKERATVANSLRLLGLAPKVREMLVAGELSQGHAKVLLSVGDPKMQLELAQKAQKAQLSVRKLEKLLASSQKDQLNSKESSAQAGALQKNVTEQLILGLADELQKIMGTKVSIDYSNSKGKISVHFYSDDELTGIVEKIKDTWQRA